MTADIFLTADGCRAYAAHIAERPLPQRPHFATQSRPPRPTVRLTDAERLTRKVLLRLALLLERDRCQS